MKMSRISNGFHRRIVAALTKGDTTHVYCSRSCTWSDDPKITLLYNPQKVVVGIFDTQHEHIEDVLLELGLQGKTLVTENWDLFKRTAGKECLQLS